MLNNLIPISGKHSISRVIASVFIPQVFIKPQDVFDNVKDIDWFIKYQKKGLLKSATINIKNNSFDISREHEPRGFMFEEYDSNGLVENILKIDNINENQSIISFETRKYIDWVSLKKRFLNDITELSEKNNFYIDAISLTYVDEFKWGDVENNIDVKSIFNIESELINQKFLVSKNGTLILIAQGKNEKNYNFEEKTEVSFNNDIKRVILNHQFAIKLDELNLFSEFKNEFLSLYDIAHEENKKILKDILTTECQSLINLK
jgi:hypothetical protein